MRRGFVQERALLTPDPVRAPPPPQLFLLVGRQPVAPLARVAIRLLEPESQRLAGHAQLTGNLGRWLPAGTRQADGLGTKLRRRGRHRLRQANTSSGPSPQAY